MYVCFKTISVYMHICALGLMCVCSHMWSFVHAHLGTCACLCFRTNICMYELSNKDMQDKYVCVYIFVRKQHKLVYAYITDKNCVVFASGYTDDVNIYDFGNV